MWSQVHVVVFELHCILVWSLWFNAFITCFIDGPANCSDMHVMPKCHVSTSDEDSRSDMVITLQNNSSLMCVVGFQVQFNGESKNVTLESPSAIFAINTTHEQLLQKEIIVHTLDFENRMGQMPCIFDISGESTHYAVHHTNVKQIYNLDHHSLHVVQQLFYSWT